MSDIVCGKFCRVILTTMTQRSSGQRSVEGKQDPGLARHPESSTRASGHTALFNCEKTNGFLIDQFEYTATAPRYGSQGIFSDDHWYTGFFHD